MFAVFSIDDDIIGWQDGPCGAEYYTVCELKGTLCEATPCVSLKVGYVRLSV